jgi:hypothetical protein
MCTTVGEVKAVKSEGKGSEGRLVVDVNSKVE